MNILGVTWIGNPRWLQPNNIFIGVTWIGNPRWLQPNNKVQMHEKCWKKNLISLKLLNQVKQI